MHFEAELEVQFNSTNPLDGFKELKRIAFMFNVPIVTIKTVKKRPVGVVRGNKMNIDFMARYIRGGVFDCLSLQTPFSSTVDASVFEDLLDCAYDYAHEEVADVHDVDAIMEILQMETGILNTPEVQKYFLACVSFQLATDLSKLLSESDGEVFEEVTSYLESVPEKKADSDVLLTFRVAGVTDMEKLCRKVLAKNSNCCNAQGFLVRPYQSADNTTNDTPHQSREGCSVGDVYNGNFTYADTLSPESDDARIETYNHDIDVHSMEFVSAVPSHRDTVTSLFSPVIRRNSTIPTRKRVVVTTKHPGQHNLCITIQEGCSYYPEDNAIIGEIQVPIQPQAMGAVKVLVEFDIDANGILKVTAACEGRVVGQCTVTNDKNRLSQKQIEDMINKEESLKSNHNRFEKARKIYCSNIITSLLTAVSGRLQTSSRDQREAAAICDEALAMVADPLSRGYLEMLTMADKVIVACRPYLFELPTIAAALPTVGIPHAPKSPVFSRRVIEPVIEEVD
eukprot:TRINITY_DN713_c3_g1_i1.p1 TRINITY_DN713_c3_g1~~TRINITY_DN713_c3_g1_i1.p1  ORF type:complete len:509 (+),score=108.64 TRINITY_DN713_c3_g1_i1:980-2506(+)